MARLKNVSNGPRRIAGHWLQPGEETEAGGDWGRHPFVVEGWVEVSGSAAPKPKSKDGSKKGSKPQESGESPMDGDAGKQE